MFRVRSTMLVRYGHYNDVLANSERLNEIAREWRQSTFWVTMSGQDNTSWSKPTSIASSDTSGNPTPPIRTPST
jgi:hypothetical protein